MAKVHCCQSPIFHSNLVEWAQKSLTQPLVLFTWTALAVMHLRANPPSLSLSPPYLYSCKVAPRPPCYIIGSSVDLLSTVL